MLQNSSFEDNLEQFWRHVIEASGLPEAQGQDAGVLAELQDVARDICKNTSINRNVAEERMKGLLEMIADGVKDLKVICLSGVAGFVNGQDRFARLVAS